MEYIIETKQKKRFKPLTAIKIALDVLMAVVFILLMDAKVISMAFHEIAGLAIGGVFLIHKLLNWKWIKNVTRHIFGRQVTAETRIRYIIDVLLFAGVYMIIISGALMSEYVFPNSAGGGDWKAIHTTLSYICIPLIGIHAGLHVKWMKNAFRKMLKITKDSKVRKWILRGFSMALAVWGIVSSITSGFFGKMIIFGGGVPENANLPSLTDSSDGTETTEGTRSYSGNTDGSSDDSATVSGTEEEGTQTVTLEQFLSSLTCTACHKNCSLLSPQCNRGVQQQEEAIAEYESMYGDTSSTESIVYSDSTGSYLQVGTAVYTLTETSDKTQTVISLANESEESASTPDTDTSFSPPGKGEHGGNGRNGDEGERQNGEQSGSGVWSTLLTYAPIVWLFGVVGWGITLLTGRKKRNVKAVEKTDNN
jgi:hypothetical protein